MPRGLARPVAHSEAQKPSGTEAWARSAEAGAMHDSGSGPVAVSGGAVSDAAVSVGVAVSAGAVSAGAIASLMSLTAVSAPRRPRRALRTGTTRSLPRCTSPASTPPRGATAAVVQVAGADATVQIDGSKLSAGATHPSPGRILVAATAISGREGKALLVTTGGGRVCAMIDADPWTLSATAMTAMPTDGNPCGAPTAEFTFLGGDTVVNAAIFTSGSQTPEATTNTVAAVDGDVTVTVDGSALSAQ